LDSVHSCLSNQSHVVFKCGGGYSFVIFFKTSLYDCILNTQYIIRCMKHSLAVEVAAHSAVQEISLFVGPGGGLRFLQELVTVSYFGAEGFSLLSHMHLLSPLNICNTQLALPSVCFSVHRYSVCTACLTTVPVYNDRIRP